MKNILKSTAQLSTAGLLLLASSTYANENNCTNNKGEVHYKHCDSQIGWYIGGQLGYGQTDISKNDIDSFYDKTGFEANSIDIDDSDLALSVMAGYQFTSHWAVEGAYIDLGDRSVDFTGRTENLTSFYDNVEHVYPQSGDGLSIAVVGSWPISNNLKLSGKLGYWRWEGDYATYDANVGVGNDSIKGNDLWFGAELNYRLSERTQVYLTAQRFSLDRDDNDVLGLGIRYYFGEKSQARQISASNKPAVIVKVAEKTVVAELDREPVTEVISSVITEIAEVAEDVIAVTPLPDDFTVYFATDKDALSQTALAKLTQVSMLLAQRDDIKASINGYASKNGQSAFNKQLSQWRAHNVQKQLYIDGLDLSRMDIGFYGDNEQADTEKDQRVDVSFSYVIDTPQVVSGQVAINFGLFSNKLSQSDVAKITAGVSAQNMNKLSHIELVSYEILPGNPRGLIELSADRADKVKAVLVDLGVKVPVLINYLWLSDEEQTKGRKVDISFFSQSK